MPLINLWRNGHYFSMAHSRFVQRYKLLCQYTWPHSGGSIIDGVALIVRSIPLPGAEFTIGRKKVLIRSPRTVYELDEFRKVRLNELAVLIQKTYRCYTKRKHFLALRRSQIVITHFWRSWRVFHLAYELLCMEKYSVVYCRNARKYGYVSSRNKHTGRYRLSVDFLYSSRQVGFVFRPDDPQKYNVNFPFSLQTREFLFTLLLRLPHDNMSPICREWPTAPSFLAETSQLLRNIFHRWRCYKYRKSFDQPARNRMREKVTASIIFKDRKVSYPRTVAHPFHGDYIRLRQNVQWKRVSCEHNDQYVVFADIINKIARSSGKVSN